MTHTLPGADIRGYYAELGIQLSGWGRTEASVRCFADPDAHRRADRDPSCSVNLNHGAWHCHACGAKGGAFDAAIAKGHSERSAIDLMVRHGITERRDERGRRRPPRPPRAAVRRAGQSRRRTLTVSEADVQRWKSELATSTAVIARLARGRGWRYETMRELELGIDRGLITIPVRDDHRRLVGLLRYQPWLRADEWKIRAVPGSRRQLLPHPAAETSRHVVLVEGEPDMIAGRSWGFPAIGLPGTDSWRPEWAQLFAGRSVLIVMDADRQGRALAPRIADDLQSYAHSKIVDLAPERDDGYDLTDWLLEHPSTPKAWVPELATDREPAIPEGD